MNERNIPPVISRSAEVAGKGVRFIAGKASEFAHDNPRATVTGLAEIAILIAGGKMIIDQATQEVIPSNYYEPPTIAAPENPTSQEILVTDEEFLTDLVEEVNSTFDLSQWVEGGEVYKPAGMCLQGVATRIEAIRPSFVGEIGNGSGVGLAIQAIDKLRNMPQFQTIELSNPPTIEQLRDFPDGTIIGMTPSQISIIDDARNKGVKYADAGHIFILMRNPENPDQLLSVSDGIWTVDRYLSEMSDSEMVAFLPVTKKLSSDNGLMYPMGSAV
ncbi:MAG TPA: hypothetical protein VK338_03660, partial [Candidatus Nitrosocosmicus sp.]|nr:hypothetical protein [Candidatus Nitrosocosmicus sp.]